MYEFHPKYWDKISEEAKDLIRKLLVIDPVNRLTVEQVRFFVRVVFFYLINYNKFYSLAVSRS